MEIKDKSVQGASVPMEDVSGVDQDIINQVLAEEGVKQNTPAAKPAAAAKPNTAEVDNDDPDNWPEDGTQKAAVTGQQPGKPPKGYVPLQALHEERIQRQQQGQQLAQMQQMLMQLQQQMTQRPAVSQQQQTQNEDPLAAMVRQQLEAVLPQVTKPVQEIHQQWQRMQEEQMLQQRVSQSETNARTKYADYDQVVEPIRQRVIADPNFARVILSFPDPAEYAYFLALGQQTQMKAATQGQSQVRKLEQMAAMPRSQQIQGGAAPSGFQNLDEMVDNFEKLSPAQQERLLRLAGG